MIFYFFNWEKSTMDFKLCQDLIVMKQTNKYLSLYANLSNKNLVELDKWIVKRAFETK